MSKKKIDFTELARKVHGNKYDYSKAEYKTMHTKVCIICPEHGEFWQEPHSHLKGQGCPSCGLKSRTEKRKDTKESFITKANKKHGGKYDYSKVNYESSQKKVCIICPEHGEFWQTPYAHIQGSGCPLCWEKKRNVVMMDDKDGFIKKAIKKHGNKYDYSKVDYKGSFERVLIMCPEHGEFWQTPNVHVRGCGCPKCGVKKTHVVMTNDEFIEKARKVHGEKYDYSKVEYKSPFSKIKIICPQHGEFEQKASYHLSGNGCPKCGVLESKWENEVFEYIKSMCPNTIRGDRKILSGKEIDIYLPDMKIGFECDGLYWHNELKREPKYHIDKTNACEEKGVRLIHIFEDEWINKKNIVKGRIESILGLIKNKVFARNCTISKISYKEASKFMDKNHLQGKVPSQFYYGLYYSNELVSLMSFGKKRKNLGSNSVDGVYEMFRFCNKNGVNVVGAASKLLKHFIKEIRPNEIVSYCDLRWSNGNLYDKLGFKLDHISQPNYFYVIGTERKNRFCFRKDALIKEGYDKNKTEHEIMLDRGIYRIYDCGCKVYKMKMEGE